MNQVVEVSGLLEGVMASKNSKSKPKRHIMEETIRSQINMALEPTCHKEITTHQAQVLEIESLKATISTASLETRSKTK